MGYKHYYFSSIAPYRIKEIIVMLLLSSTVLCKYNVPIFVSKVVGHSHSYIRNTE